MILPPTLNSPFFFTMSYKELVQLLPLEFLLVLRILGESVLVRNWVVLGWEPGFEGQHVRVPVRVISAMRVMMRIHDSGHSELQLISLSHLLCAQLTDDASVQAAAHCTHLHHLHHAADRSLNRSQTNWRSRDYTGPTLREDAYWVGWTRVAALLLVGTPWVAVVVLVHGSSQSPCIKKIQNYSYSSQETTKTDSFRNFNLALLVSASL